MATLSRNANVKVKNPISLALARGVEKALVGTRDWLGRRFRSSTRRSNGIRSSPKWAPAPLLKTKQNDVSDAAAGRARPTRSARECVKEVRTEILAGERDLSTLIDGKPGEDPREDRRAGRQDPDGEDVSEARHFRRRDGHRSGVPGAHRAALSRPRLPGADHAAAQPRSSSTVKYGRERAHGGSDQPLQHDVRPVLHGREPGRLRSRALVRRGEADPRRRGQHQAASARCPCIFTAIPLTSRLSSRKSINLTV